MKAGRRPREKRGQGQSIKKEKSAIMWPQSEIRQNGGYSLHEALNSE